MNMYTTGRRGTASMIFYVNPGKNCRLGKPLRIFISGIFARRFDLKGGLADD